LPLAEREHPTIRGAVDVVLIRRGRVSALFDAKYKIFDGTPGASDVFQMIAYMECLGLDNATLVYPGSRPRRTVVVGRRRVHAIGIEPTPEGLASTKP
jgi:predicted component of viral defense system (DUF524 family)